MIGLLLLLLIAPTPLAVSQFRTAVHVAVVNAPFMIGIDEALGSETRRGGADMVRRECDIVALGGSCSGVVRTAARREAALAMTSCLFRVQSFAENDRVDR